MVIRDGEIKKQGKHKRRETTCRCFTSANALNQDHYHLCILREVRETVTHIQNPTCKNPEKKKEVK